MIVITIITLHKIITGDNDNIICLKVFINQLINMSLEKQKHMKYRHNHFSLFSIIPATIHNCIYNTSIAYSL